MCQKVYVHPGLYAPPTTYYPPSTSLSASSSSSSSSSQAQVQSQRVVLKYRFPKTYRHPTLDAQLTKTRLSFEARALARCARAGVTVPRVVWVDEAGGVLGLEMIEGWSVREILGGGAEGEAQEEEEIEREVESDGQGQGGAVQGTVEAQTTEESEGMVELSKLGVGPGMSRC